MDTPTAVEVAIYTLLPKQTVPQAVYQINTQALAYPYTEQEINLLRETKDTFIAVAKVGGTTNIVGFMIYNMDYTIHTIAVRDKYRNRAVGAQLINWLKNDIAITGSFAAKIKAKKKKKKASQESPPIAAIIQVAIREDNLNAQTFFKKHEFFAVEIIQDFYPQGDNAYLLQYPKDERALANFQRQKRRRKHNPDAPKFKPTQKRL